MATHKHAHLMMQYAHDALEQDRSEHIGTHGKECHTWGPRHYERLVHEIERLNAALKWEQDRSEHVGTHGQGCHTWGQRHYECLLREYKELSEKPNLFETAVFYTAPPKRKPLSDEEIHTLAQTMVKGHKSVNWLCRAIEQAHDIGVDK